MWIRDYIQYHLKTLMEIFTVVQNELNRKQRLALVVDGQGTNTEIFISFNYNIYNKNNPE